MERAMACGGAIAAPAGASGAGRSTAILRADATLVISGALASMLATGFVFGVDNNLFQLPILGRLYDLPQFAGDPFIQSLRYYASGVWRALEGSDRWIEPIHLLFALALASRIIAFAGFLACARLLGVRTARQRLLFVALLASADLMLGYSYAGSNGLFLNHATHSELANGLVLLAFAMAARGRLTAALAFAGATFFCNAFIGAWTLVVVGVMTLWLVWRGALGFVEAFRKAAIGGSIFAAFAAPVIVTIVSNPEFGATTPIDYRAYLEGYWPKHFLVWTVPTPELVALALVGALTLLSLAALGRRSAPFRVCFGALAGLYALGVAIPYVTGSQTLINLHFLRVSGPLQMLAVLASLSLVTRWATGSDPWRARLLAPGAILALCAAPAATLVAIIIIMLDRVRGPIRDLAGRALSAGGVGPAIALGCGLVTAGAFAHGALAENGRNAALTAMVGDWEAVGRWVRANTSPDVVFLTPAVDLSRQAVGLSYDRSLAPLAATGADFEYVSQRRVFVDFKRGGAAPWTPSYYEPWRRKIDETLTLGSLPERRAYAARQGVAYVIDRCSGEEPLFEAGALCVYSAGA